MTASTLRIATTLLSLVGLMSQLGCAFGEFYPNDPMLREYSLGEIQKTYTNYVRFQNFQMAARYVDPEQTEEFYAIFPKASHFIFTDFEPGPINFEDPEDMTKATVIVEYTGYYSDSMVVVDITETQEWFRDSKLNNWRVRPNFEGLRKLAAN